ncbi:MAG: PqqD family protein [Bacteroidales bacterium]|nr:PqqD family protein [Bacteroidales bacterium]MBP3663210.1 PqqD family protein [Bacteroidales bacterium]MBR6731437.1 PqqD family protein [Bacteroidales bacterium]
MKTKDGFILREMCGEYIISGEGLEHINFNKLISLNSTAAFLWNAVVGKEFTAESMAQLLVDEYGIDMELALKDSKALCQSWIEAGIAE